MTKNKSLKLNISIIPVIIILLVIAGGVYFFSKGEIPFLEEDDGKIETSRLEGFPLIVDTPNIVDKQRAIITSEEELNAFLETFDTYNSVAIQENIDFEKDMLIGVSSKTLDTSGYRLKIQKIIEDPENGGLLVSAELEEPGDTCEVEEYPNVAVDIIKMEKTDKPIDFERFKKEVEC